MILKTVVVLGYMRYYQYYCTVVVVLLPVCIEQYCERCFDSNGIVASHAQRQWTLLRICSRSPRLPYPPSRPERAAPFPLPLSNSMTNDESSSSWLCAFS